MARMKDFKDKITNLRDIFKTEKPDDNFLKLCYDTSLAINNVVATEKLCVAIRHIGSYGLVTYNITIDDKKTKKTSLNSLSALFSETSMKFQDTDPMRGPLNYNSTLLAKIIDIRKLYEKEIQHQVMEPLSQIEINCAEIQELRKKLQDLRRELATLYDKLERMAEQVNFDEQKVQAFKLQIEEIELEFDNISDLYLQKILTFEAQEFEHAQAIHAMLLLRSKFHKECAEELMQIIPKVNQFIEERRTPFSFHCPLENHLREIRKGIAYPIEKCVTALDNTHALRQEGLFRVSGSKLKSNLLCSCLNIMRYDRISYKWSPHVLADALKRYLREMPVHLLSKASIAEWDRCFETFKTGQKLKAYNEIKDLLNRMPKSYYSNLEYVIKFLNKVVHEKSYNLMNVQNICTVFTPNLFTQTNEPLEGFGTNMELNVTPNFVLESLLNDTQFFFGHPDDISDYQTSILSASNTYSISSNEPIYDSICDTPILYRPRSSNPPEMAKERSNIEDRQQRRRQRCIDADIFNSTSESQSISISTMDSITSISSEPIVADEPSRPVAPPRKHRK